MLKQGLKLPIQVNPFYSIINLVSSLVGRAQEKQQLCDSLNPKDGRIFLKITVMDVRLLHFLFDSSAQKYYFILEIITVTQRRDDLFRD